MKKRILQLALLVCVLAALFVALSVTASAASSGTCGDNLTWILDDAGTLTIRGKGAMRDYADVANVFWYSEREKIVCVEIESGVTSIGRGAFNRCSSLTSIEIPDGVTSIGEYAFENCSSLTSIEIPDSVTSIGDYAFYDCSSLTSIEIPDSVTSIGDYAFRGCSSLTSIEIPDGVTSIGDYAFRSCSSLTSIEIPDSVTSIGDYAFRSCSSLTSIEIPDSVTSIGESAFSGCSSLINITLPFVGGSTSKNTYIGYIFGAGSYSGNSEYVPASLTTVEITSGETIPSNAFYGCSKLRSITILDGVTRIRSSAFKDCSKLTSIIIPDSVTNIEVDVFAGCTSLQKITLPFVGSSREANGTTDALFGYLFGNVSGIEKRQYYSPSNYTTYKIPSSLKSVTITDADVIPYGAFYNCSNLDNIILNSTVSTVYSETFYNCSSLMKITIPAEKLKMASTNVFSGCDMLTIYGIEGSDVEEYATKYSIDFEPIGAEAVETTLTASAEIIGGNIVVTAKANGSTTDKFMPVAVYNKDNEMLDLIIIPSNEDFEVVKVVFKDIADASYVKLFLWDSYSDLTPLETAKEVGIAR